MSWCEVQRRRHDINVIEFPTDISYVWECGYDSDVEERNPRVRGCNKCSIRFSSEKKTEMRLHKVKGLWWEIIRNEEETSLRKTSCVTSIEKWAH